jgi:hypothetical protein
MNGLWPWIAVAILGAYHGIDPSMGWLFAVALGLQERRRTKVLVALLPIALGHLLSIAVIVGSIALAMRPASGWLRPVGAAALIGFGLFRFWRPRAHPRWVAMRVNSAELAAWSFLMATAHGAGLMLFPILVDLHSASMSAHKHMHRAMTMPPPAHATLGVVQTAAIILLHTGAMLLVMGVIAFAVYEWIGLKILRSAWINLDEIWAGALIAAGALSLVI